MLMSLAFWGCRERIFLESVPDDFQLISINGLINNSEGPYLVEIQETRDADRAPIPIETAEVLLFDGEGNREVCNHQENGKYSCPGNVVRGVTGGMYHIEVRLGNDIYRSVPEMMPATILATNQFEWEEVAIPSTTSAGIDIETTVLDFDMFAQLPEVSEPVYLQWQFVETFQIRETDFPDPFGAIPLPCFITQNAGVQNFYTLALNEFTGSEYSLESVIQRDIDISFLVKHIFSIQQSSVTEGYFNYLQQVRSLTETTGSLFDPPAGRISGNIEHEGDGLTPIGFFTAVVTDTTHIAIYRDDIATNIVDVCRFDVTKFSYPVICRDCLAIPRSTHTEPFWWSKVR
jgi:hypothetical protein